MPTFRDGRYLLLGGHTDLGSDTGTASLCCLLISEISVQRIVAGDRLYSRGPLRICLRLLELTRFATPVGRRDGDSRLMVRGRSVEQLFPGIQLSSSAGTAERLSVTDSWETPDLGEVPITITQTYKFAIENAFAETCESKVQ